MQMHKRSLRVRSYWTRSSTDVYRRYLKQKLCMANLTLFLLSLQKAFILSTSHHGNPLTEIWLLCMTYFFHPSVGVVICISMDSPQCPQWYLQCRTFFIRCRRKMSVDIRVQYEHTLSLKQPDQRWTTHHQASGSPAAVAPPGVVGMH